MDQVQTDGSFFKMPLEIGINGSEKEEQLVKKVQADQIVNSFTFSLNFTPATIVLDPNFYVLMEAEFKEK